MVGQQFIQNQDLRWQISKNNNMCCVIDIYTHNIFPIGRLSIAQQLIEILNTYEYTLYLYRGENVTNTEFEMAHCYLRHTWSDYNNADHEIICQIINEELQHKNRRLDNTFKVIKKRCQKNFNSNK